MDRAETNNKCLIINTHFSAAFIHVCAALGLVLVGFHATIFIEFMTVKKQLSLSDLPFIGHTQSHTTFTHRSRVRVVIKVPP